MKQLHILLVSALCFTISFSPSSSFAMEEQNLEANRYAHTVRLKSLTCIEQQDIPAFGKDDLRLGILVDGVARPIVQHRIKKGEVWNFNERDFTFHFNKVLTIRLHEFDYIGKDNNLGEVNIYNPGGDHHFNNDGSDYLLQW